MSTIASGTQPSAQSRAIEARAYAKATWRLLPFLFLCYVAAYLDRVNVGFAKLQMLNDLQFSETVYGLGAGIFFIGYFFFEVPSNIIMHKVGARRWIARIMISWAVLSAATLFVKTPTQFYVVRFLLGVAEAGFFPGIVLYLTYWFPAQRRGRMNALFMIGIPVAGVFGGPLSGWILAAFNGVGGWAAWQWLFFIEAIPSVILGVITLMYLPNGIRAATWLTEDEKAVLEHNIAQDSAGKVQHSVASVFANGRVWLMAAIYFCCMMGLYGIGFYLPTLIKASGVKSALDVGLLTAIPYACAVLSMIVVARSSDRTRERRWHFAVVSLAGAVGLYLSTVWGNNVPLAMVALSVGTAGMLATMPVFWTYPSALLVGGSAAAAIGMINSIGNLAGFVSPFVIGWLKDVTQSTNAGMYCVSAALALGAVLALTQSKAQVNR
ncbi:MFS transporter [Pandoraea pnomenusa 3kgm]|uniref:MFS transporter n=1 Tax=Pandoraea pnomenusa TaxID=93220 RepID=UPI0004375F52|nr:MFS transporter [Pandoraea pnomenusa]AHB05226.2 MFS transporter [Pandoraea pnomenusa 3kgm]AHN77255.1 MFS transporter [Pandoraea pnomenusa]